jgi:hypothetical protein
MATVASYAGQSIFGYAVNIVHIPNPTIQQNNSFFGINGMMTIYGGSRGRRFDVTGLFWEPDALSVRVFDETLMQSFADGIPRTLVDSYGYAWPNVIFQGELQLGRVSFNPNGLGGVAIEYKATFHGLT